MKTSLVHLRLSEEDRLYLEDRARKSGRKLSEWIRWKVMTPDTGEVQPTRPIPKPIAPATGAHPTHRPFACSPNCTSSKCNRWQTPMCGPCKATNMGIPEAAVHN